jgi:hypothetical protein
MAKPLLDEAIDQDTQLPPKDSDAFYPAAPCSAMNGRFVAADREANTFRQNLSALMDILDGKGTQVTRSATTSPGFP